MILRWLLTFYSYCLVSGMMVISLQMKFAAPGKDIFSRHTS